jgi:hypothetical protein
MYNLNIWMEKAMTIEQTVEIPTNRRLTIEIPEEVPVGKARVLIQFPFKENELVVSEAEGQINNEAFRNALIRAYGAWKDNPWTNHVEDINAMRDEWEHRDSWDQDAARNHQD